MRTIKVRTPLQDVLQKVDEHVIHLRFPECFSDQIDEPLGNHRSNDENQNCCDQVGAPRDDVVDKDFFEIEFGEVEVFQVHSL